MQSSGYGSTNQRREDYTSAYRPQASPDAASQDESEQHQTPRALSAESGGYTPQQLGSEGRDGSKPGRHQLLLKSFGAVDDAASLQHGIVAYRLWLLRSRLLAIATQCTGIKSCKRWRSYRRTLRKSSGAAQTCPNRTDRRRPGRSKCSGIKGSSHRRSNAGAIRKHC